MTTHSDTLHRPVELYRMRVQAGKFSTDPVQDRAIAALDRLYGDILQQQGQLQGEKTGWLRKMMRFSSNTAAFKGVYLHGSVGRGKTMLMDTFYESLPASIKKRRVHFHAFMIEVHDYIHSRREEDGIRDGIDSALPSLAAVIAQRSTVLCFDEFHVTDVADAMILGRLFTAIFDMGVAVVCTSNWAPDDLYKGGLQRDRFIPFIDFLKKNMEVVYLNSTIDYRARKLMESPVYFQPLNSVTRNKAEQVFQGLTDGEEPYSDLVVVKGRTIEVPVVANGVARFNFSQLCERPLGAEDYIAIARRYHTIFLEDIPRLGYDRRNEAKRLMTLIDVLYDAKRNVVITADETLDRLYSGHDHAFEFQRTISRLMEMQSIAYLNHSA